MNAFQRGIVKGTRFGGFVALACAPAALVVNGWRVAVFLAASGAIYIAFAELLRYVGSRP